MQHIQLFENPLPGTPPIRDSQLWPQKLFFFSRPLLVVGFLYGAGAETLIFVTGTLGNICPQDQTKKTSSVYPENKKNKGFGYPVPRSNP